MPTLAPKLQSGVAYEQPIEPPQSLLGSLVNLGTGVLASTPRPKAPTENERKREALGPFAQKLYDLKYNSDLSDADFQRKARDISRQQLIATPEFSTDINRLSSELYGIEEETLVQTAEDTRAKMYNEFTGTAEGQAAFVESMTLDKDGVLDVQATNEKYLSKLYQVKSEEAQLAASNRRLALIQNDANQWKATSEQELKKTYLPAWQDRSREMVSGLLSAYFAGNEAFDEPQEQLDYLRQTRTFLLDTYRAKVTSAGFEPSVVEAQLEAAVKPLDDMITMATSSIQDKTNMNAALKSALETNSINAFVEVFGVFAGDPEFRSAASTMMTNSGLYNREGISKTIETMRIMGERKPGINFMPDLPINTADTLKVAKEGGSVLDSTEVQKTRTEIEADPSQRTTYLNAANDFMTAADMTTPEGTKMVLRSVSTFLNIAEATDQPLGKTTLNKFLSPDNVRKLQEAASGSSAASVDVKNAFAYFAYTQERRNRAIVDARLQGSRNYDLEDKDGVLTLYRTDRRGNREPVSQSNSAMAPAIEAINNINKLRSTSKRLTTGDETVAGAEGDTSLGGGQGEDTLGSPTALQGLIDATEGAGSYDTLYKHSQKNTFSGVNVSSMTIGELSAFSNGAYGDWSKGELGYKATPMGRYQIVGGTLDRVAKAMGLSSDVIFTPEVQDAMFVYLAKEALAGKTSVDAKRSALRKVWEGFRSVPNTQLDAAIAQFEGTPIPNIDPQTRASQFASFKSAPTKEDFTPAVAPSSGQGGDSTATPERVDVAEIETKITEVREQLSSDPSSVTQEQLNLLFEQTQKLLELTKRA